MIAWLLVLLGGLGAQQAAPAPKPRTHTVEIRGMAFEPAVDTVAVGDTIVWVNRDIVPHTATASGHTKWDTGQIRQGQTGRYVATQRGEARYVCSLHPTMHGRLVIR